MWASIIIMALFFSLTNIKVCHSTGKLSVQLLKYKNSDHKLKDNGCCDNAGIFGGCSDACDNYFKICATGIFEVKCNLGDITTKVLGDDDMTFPGKGGDLGNGNRNPLVFSFDTWKGSTLSIEIWDHESDRIFHGPDDLVDTLSLDIPNTPDPGSHNASTHEVTLRSATSSTKRYMELSFQVYCDVNFLVPDCDRECIARDDHEGHYTCDYVNGAILCNQNWYGDRCTKYCSSRQDIYGHYTCDNFGEKNCSANWFGVNCTHYCQPRDDITGHYSCTEKTGAKLCLPSWFDEDCVTYCLAQNNEDGHYICDSTTGAKICLQNWYGGNCSKFCMPQDTSSGHFLCDVTGDKVCLSGWQGENCAEKIQPTANNAKTIQISSDKSSLKSDTVHGITQLSSHGQPIATPNTRSNSVVTSDAMITKQHHRLTPSSSEVHLDPTTSTARLVSVMKHTVQGYETPSTVLTVSTYNLISSSSQHTTVLDYSADTSTTSIVHAITTDVNTALVSTTAMTTTEQQQQQQRSSSENQQASGKLESTKIIPTTKGSDSLFEPVYSSSANLASSELQQRPSEMTATVGNIHPSFSQPLLSMITMSFSSPSLQTYVKQETPTHWQSSRISDSTNPARAESTSEKTLAFSASVDRMFETTTNTPHGSQITSTPETTAKEQELGITPSQVSAFQTRSSTVDLEKRTLRYIVHLPTKWHQKNRTTFESSLLYHLKKAHALDQKTDEYSDYMNPNVTAVEECSDNALLSVEISFVKARIRSEELSVSERGIETILRKIFNTNEIIRRSNNDDTDEQKLSCEYKTNRYNVSKLPIIIVAALLLGLLIGLLLTLILLKVKKRTTLTSKVHPQSSEESNSKTKKRIPSAQSNQSLLQLDDLKCVVGEAASLGSNENIDSSLPDVS